VKRKHREKIEREAEEAKLRIEAEERRKLGLGPTPEELAKEEQEKHAKIKRDLEMEQARKEAIERAEAAKVAGRRVDLTSNS